MPSQRRTIPGLLATILAFSTVALTQSFVTVTSQPSGSSSPTTTSRIPQTTYVDVGKGDHTFRPDTIQAAIGDIITFRFYPVNHSVVRADYLSPCIPYELNGRGKTGFFAGFHPVDAILDSPPSWSIRINDTDPIFFYCSAPGSCNKWGMVGVINPNATTSLTSHREVAMKAQFVLQPGDRFPSESDPSLSSSAAATSTSSSKTTSTSSAAQSSTAPAVAASQGSHMSGGAIAGAVIGGIGGLALLAAVFFLLGRTKTMSQQLKRESAIIIPPGAKPFDPYQPRAYSGVSSPMTMTQYYEPPAYPKPGDGHGGVGVDEMSLRAASPPHAAPDEAVAAPRRTSGLQQETPRHGRRSVGPHEMYA